MSKIKQLTLTPEELEVFLDATNAYQQILEKKKEEVGTYLNMGINAGLIHQSGEEYVQDRHYWVMRDAIRKVIDKENEAIINLRKKIWEIVRK